MPFSACGGVVALSSFDTPRTAAAPRVAVAMGSDSDLPTMQPAVQVLEQFGVAVEVRVLSAHRTPLEMVDFAQTARERGFKVIIAGAGGAAHLPGMLASLTTLPVIGVPVQSTASTLACWRPRSSPPPIRAWPRPSRIIATGSMARCAPRMPACSSSAAGPIWSRWADA